MLRSFWALFGFYDPPAISEGRGTTMVAPLFMWIYLLVAVVLFVGAE